MVVFSERRSKLILSGLSVVAVLLFAGMVLASGGGESHADNGAVMKDFVWRVVNFVILAGILFWALKKANLKGALADRQVQIEKIFAMHVRLVMLLKQS